MLGSGIFFLGLPLGLIYSVRAVRKSGDRGFAWAGLVLSIIAWTIIGLAIFVNVAGP
jgi:hypothetical protein